MDVLNFRTGSIRTFYFLTGTLSFFVMEMGLTQLRWTIVFGGMQNVKRKRGLRHRLHPHDHRRRPTRLTQRECINSLTRGSGVTRMNNWSGRTARVDVGSRAEEERRRR